MANKDRFVTCVCERKKKNATPFYVSVFLTRLLSRACLGKSPSRFIKKRRAKQNKTGVSFLPFFFPLSPLRPGPSSQETAP